MPARRSGAQATLLRNPLQRESNRIDPLYVTRQLSSKSTVKHPTVTWSNGHVMQVIRHGWGCGISSPYPWATVGTEKVWSAVFAVEIMCPLGAGGRHLRTSAQRTPLFNGKNCWLHFLGANLCQHVLKQGLGAWCATNHPHSAALSVETQSFHNRIAPVFPR